MMINVQTHEISLQRCSVLEIEKYKLEINFVVHATAERN